MALKTRKTQAENKPKDIYLQALVWVLWHVTNSQLFLQFKKLKAFSYFLIYNLESSG